MTRSILRFRVAPFFPKKMWHTFADISNKNNDPPIGEGHGRHAKEFEYYPLQRSPKKEKHATELFYALLTITITATKYHYYLHYYYHSYH